MSRRTVIIGLSTLVVLGVIVFFWGERSSALNEVEVQTAVIERTTITLTVEGAGTITPEHSVALMFGVSGVVQTIPVDEGNTVEAGQLLASLDTGDLELQIALAEQAIVAQQAMYDGLIAGPTDAELNQARASVSQAQASLASATMAHQLSAKQVIIQCAGLSTAAHGLEVALDAYDDYQTNGLEIDPTFTPDPDSKAGLALRDAQKAYDIVAAQCDVAETQNDDTSTVDNARALLNQAQARLEGLLEGATQYQMDSAAAALETARIQLQQAQSRRDDARLTAPFSGIVTDVSITAGQRVGTNTVAITLADTSQLHLNVNVDELDIPDVQKGQSATIRLESLPDTEFVGQVTNISSVGRVNQGIVTYTVRVDLTDSNPSVLLGMSADVEITIGALQDVLVVPRNAILRNTELGEYVLVQQSNGEANRVPVTSGISKDGMIVIEGDLTAEQTVLLSEPTESRRRGLSLFGG